MEKEGDRPKSRFRKVVPRRPENHQGLQKFGLSPFKRPRALQSVPTQIDTAKRAIAAIDPKQERRVIEETLKAINPARNLTKLALYVALGLLMIGGTGTWIYSRAVGFNDKPRAEARNLGSGLKFEELKKLLDPESFEMLTCLRETLSDRVRRPFTGNRWVADHCPTGLLDNSETSAIIHAKDVILTRAGYDPSSVVWEFAFNESTETEEFVEVIYPHRIQ